ncbi:hypothetical protein [Nonomuraea sp. NEAU-A123]|nr:hypothetical protein [Nonomuraea sp. NEAU-A123]
MCGPVGVAVKPSAEPRASSVVATADLRAAVAITNRPPPAT